MTLRIVSETSEAEIRRKEALEEIDRALRELTANLMRVVRGAGKSYEIFGQIDRCRTAFIKHYEASGALPSSFDLDQMLKMRDKSGELYKCADEKSLERWRADGSFAMAAAEDRIRGGVLRAIAAELLKQKLQESHGENELHEGLRMYEEAVSERRRAANATRMFSAKADRGRRGKKPTKADSADDIIL